MKFDSIEEAIEDIRQGKMVIVVDDEDRENEGDFVMAADRISCEAINFMISVGRGLLCTPITSQRAQELQLPLMVPNNNVDLEETSFTVSIDSRNVGSGVSCKERVMTILDLVREETQPEDLKRPGHIFPLIARDGGVLVRRGHTEAAIDLAVMAGCAPVGVLCEILNEDGTMARRDDLYAIAKKYALKLITIEDLVQYRERAITV